MSIKSKKESNNEKPRTLLFKGKVPSYITLGAIGLPWYIIIQKSINIWDFIAYCISIIIAAYILELADYYFRKKQGTKST